MTVFEIINLFMQTFFVGMGILAFLMGDHIPAIYLMLVAIWLGL